MQTGTGRGHKRKKQDAVGIPDKVSKANGIAEGQRVLIGGEVCWNVYRLAVLVDLKTRRRS